MQPREAWLQRGFQQWPIVFIFVFALILRVGYYIDVSDTAVWQWERWNDSDMDTFLKVARQVLNGDLLVREPYHPIHGWHENIASPEDWQAWAPPHVFYQVPGYYYLLALYLKLFSGSLTAVKVFQMFLGALHTALLGAVGQRILGRAGGLTVGLFAASYGPFLAAEPLLLREGIGLLLATLSFYLTLRALDLSYEAHLRDSAWLWFITGLLLGLGALSKETGFVLFAAIWLWLLIRRIVNVRAADWVPASLVLIGFAVGMSPLILRNVAVGAPAFAVSSNAGLTFMLGNTADLPSSGVNFYEDAPSFKPIVRQSHGRFLSSVMLTLQTYAGQPGGFLRNIWTKFAAVWSNVELPDNYSYAHFTLHSTLLRFLPRFVCVWLPAVLGLLLLAIRWGSNRAERRHAPSAVGGRLPEFIPFSPEVLGLIVVILGLQAASMSLAPVTSRYRMVMVPFLMLVAGWAIAQGLAWLVYRRWAWLGLWSGLFLAVTVVWAAWPANPKLQPHALRPDHFRIAARILAEQGDFSAARAEFELGITYFLAHQDSARALYVRRDRLLDFALKDHAHEVVEDLDILSRLMPGDSVIDIALRHMGQAPTSGDVNR